MNQTPTLSQEDVQLQGKEKYDWEIPNRKGCKWNNPLPEWPLLWICTSLETSLAWDKYIQNNEEDKPRHLIQDSSSAP